MATPSRRPTRPSETRQQVAAAESDSVAWSTNLNKRNAPRNDSNDVSSVNKPDSGDPSTAINREAMKASSVKKPGVNSKGESAVGQGRLFIDLCHSTDDDGQSPLVIDLCDSTDDDGQCPELIDLGDYETDDKTEMPPHFIVFVDSEGEPLDTDLDSEGE